MDEEKEKMKIVSRNFHRLVLDIPPFSTFHLFGGKQTEEMGGEEMKVVKFLSLFWESKWIDREGSDRWLAVATSSYQPRPEMTWPTSYPPMLLPCCCCCLNEHPPFGALSGCGPQQKVNFNGRFIAFCVSFRCRKKIWNLTAFDGVKSPRWDLWLFHQIEFELFIRNFSCRGDGA